MFAVPITGGVVCAHFGLAAGPRCRRMIYAAETTHSNREGPTCRNFPTRQRSGVDVAVRPPVPAPGDPALADAPRLRGGALRALDHPAVKRLGRDVGAVGPHGGPE